MDYTNNMVTEFCAQLPEPFSFTPPKLMKISLAGHITWRNELLLPSPSRWFFYYLAKSKTTLNTVTVAIAISKLSASADRTDVLRGTAPAEVRSATSIQSRYPTSLNRPATVVDKNHRLPLPTQHINSVRLR